MRTWRARVSVAVAVAAVLLALLAAGEGRKARKPVVVRCSSDTACGANKVCLSTGRCGSPNDIMACSATRPCSALAPSDAKRCKANSECTAQLTCARNTGLGYNTCMCPGDTKWIEGGLFTGVCGFGEIGGPGGGPLPWGCGCEDGKWLKSPGSSECVDEADCPLVDDSDGGAPADPAADKSAQPVACGANEQWYDVVPCPAKCRASDAPVMCAMVVKSGCGCSSGLASVVDGSVVCKARSECDANAA
jgi:hypothetical protein